MDFDFYNHRVTKMVASVTTHQEADADRSDDRVDRKPVLLEECHKGKTTHLREYCRQQESAHVRYLVAQRA